MLRNHNFVVAHHDFDCNRKGTVFTGVYLFICMISQKPMQLGSPSVTNKCSTMSPGNSSILESKGEGHEAQKAAVVGLCTLVSAGFFYLIMS